MLKKMFFLIGLLCLGILASCQTNEAAGGQPGHEPEYGQEIEVPLNAVAPIEIDHRTIVGNADFDLLQAGLPEPGDTIVILHTSMGDITLRMFPEEAPLAYENFVTHARNGYYDGVIFHRVMEGFMLQGGDPEGTGRGGESIWGHGFDVEFSFHLRHFRGALAMAHAGRGTLGSQFYIVHSTDARRFAGPDIMAEFDAAAENQDEFLGEDNDGNRIYLRDLVSVDMVEAYLRYGGTPHLDLVFNPQGHTVFGQVVAGMDVVDAIAAVETDGDPPQGANRPLQDVVIESVTVTEFN